MRAFFVATTSHNNMVSLGSLEITIRKKVTSENIMRGTLFLTVISRGT
jgi:hypothetical protein